MVKVKRPTWWQRLRHRGCTHVIYMDEKPYRKLVKLLRLEQGAARGPRRRS